MTYFAAWNEPDPERRVAILQRSLADDAELLDPTGRWQGIDGFVERIGNYQTAAPDTTVAPASGIDAHNDVVRYAWTIVDAEGQDIWRASTSPSAQPTDGYRSAPTPTGRDSVAHRPALAHLTPARRRFAAARGSRPEPRSSPWWATALRRFVHRIPRTCSAA